VQKLIYGIGGTLLLIIIIGFALPQQHRIEETIEIDAHPATIFALVNDFHRFSQWVPWAKTDPNARFLYSGATRGEGAIMTWDGAVIGSGAQVITESRAYEYVGIAMNPGEDGEARSWFDVTRGIGNTQVKWGFETDHGMNIVGRYFAAMLGGIVARDYHDGLVQLKQLAESLPAADFSDLEIEHIVVAANDIAFLPTSSSPDPATVAEALRVAYFRVLTFIDKNNLELDGAPLSITRNFNGAELAFDAGIPVRGLNDDTPRASAGIQIGATYAGPVLRVKHIGSYKRLGDSHNKVSAYLAALGIERNGAVWESYVSDPGKVQERNLLTYLYYPVTVD